MEGFFMDRIFGPTTTSSTTNFIELISESSPKNSSTTFRMKAWSSGENVSFTSFFDIMAVNKTFHPPKYPQKPGKVSRRVTHGTYIPPPGLQTALISRTWQRTKPINVWREGVGSINKKRQSTSWIPLRMLLVGWWVQQMKTYSPNGAFFNSWWCIMAYNA